MPDADRRSSKQTEWEPVFMKRFVVHLFQGWSKDWNLTVFLALLIIMVFIVAPLDHMSLGVVGRLLVNIFFSFFFIAGVAAVSEKRALTLLASGIIVITISIRWMSHMIPGPALESASMFSSIVGLGLLTVVVLLQTFQKGPITWHRIQGAIAAYLLLGLIWAVAYRLVLLQISDSSQPAGFGQRQGASMADLVYFSFATLTTVGYGDITPAHPEVRSLAMLEALVGQLYPAILIGRLVALELQYRKPR